MRKLITVFKTAKQFALVRTPSSRKPIVAPDAFSRLSSILESCRVHSMPLHFCAFWQKQQHRISLEVSLIVLIVLLGTNYQHYQ